MADGRVYPAVALLIWCGLFVGGCHPESTVRFRYGDTHEPVTGAQVDVAPTGYFADPFAKRWHDGGELNESGELVTRSFSPDGYNMRVVLYLEDRFWVWEYRPNVKPEGFVTSSVSDEAADWVAGEDRGFQPRWAEQEHERVSVEATLEFH